MLLGTGLDPLLPSERPHRLNILPYDGVMTSITVTKGPTFKSDLSPAIHGGVQPSDHSRAERYRRRPGSQDGPQPAPTGLQADDLGHAECRVGFHTFLHVA